MNKVFKNINVLTEVGYKKMDVTIQDHKFYDLKENNDDQETNLLMIPGFIDEHTHGAIGIDFSTVKTKEKVEELLNYYISKGVTSVFPTMLTEKDELIFNQLELLYEVSKTNPVIKGIHLEGPFLSLEYKGAQEESCLQKPTISKCKDFINHSHGLFKLMTLAPELEGSKEVINFLVKNNIEVSLGHSSASAEDAKMALENGARCITHLFNAMKPIHHHAPSISSAALNYDGFYTEVILDGIHIHPQMVETIRKIKGNDKMIGITDSLMAAGLPDGEYFIGNNPIIVKNHDCVLKDSGVRAGSTLTMDLAFKHIKEYCNIDDLEASKICSLNSAKMLKIDDKYGSIKEGKIADFIIMDKDHNILEVYVNGERKY